MSSQTIDIHHNVIHANLAHQALGMLDWFYEIRNMPIEHIIRHTGGDVELEHVHRIFSELLNHNYFWHFMSAQKSEMPSRLATRLAETFGSVKLFKAAFNHTAARQYGVGWVWLVEDKDGKLAIERSACGSFLASEDHAVLLCCDVSEHSYFLDYKADKAAYVKNWLDNLANYEFASSRLR